MSVQLKHDRWFVSDSDFAVRVIVPDLKGYFDKLPILGSAPRSRSLVIEPGTRALVVDDGILVGDVPAGEYTLETFVERLQFWRKKQATVILIRCEDVPIESSARNVPCLDGVFFDVSYRWTVQLNDSVPFLNNLMGAGDTLPVTKLEETIAPMVRQALRDTIGQSPYEQVCSTDFVGQAEDGIRARVGAKLERYGLALQDVQAIQFDGGGDFAQRKGEAYLASRETQLQRAAAAVENDKLAVRLEDYEKKIPVRKALRDAICEDNLDKVRNREDFKLVLADVDKQRLLRKEDHDILVDAYEERKQHRQQLREHLLATLDLQREQELEELRLDLDHAVRMKSLNQEIELARQSRAGDAEKWQADLERDKETATHRWQQKHGAVKARWDRIREAHRQKRDDSWEALLHQQKMEEVHADLELARAERNRKLVLLQAELNARLEAEKLEIQKRQQEWELEFRERKSGSQMDRLQRVQEMNAQFVERQQRMQIDLENLKEDGAHKRAMERIQTIGNMSTEAMIATAGVDNAALLADLKKHEATQDMAKAQAGADPATELNEERARLYEKMNETERAKADAIAEVYKAALQAQQSSVQQMIGGLAQVGTGFSPPKAPAEIWYASLNGQQSPPLNVVQVQQYIASGQINASTMVWKTGLSNWLPAQQCPELALWLSSGGAATPPPLRPGPLPA